jgi:hypothetical protein
MRLGPSLAAACVLLAAVLAAQDTPRGPDGGTTHRVSGVEVLNIPGKPFSAKTSTDWTRTLDNGSTQTLHLDARLARDSEGRVYRERHNFVPAGSSRSAPLYEIDLFDPVRRTRTLCNGRTQVCVVTGFRPQTAFAVTPEGTYLDGTRTLTRDQLGTDTVEGIPVIVTRETWTVSAGAAGNDQPMVSTREFWYSDDLETNLAVTRLDPVEGKQVIRLSEISRSEPDPHLWDIPIGFTVRDERAAAPPSR